MTDAQRIVFTNETPNSHNSIVKNSTIDFKRFTINPILLADHDWKALPIGHMVDIKLEHNGYSGVPVFHEITEQSKTYKALYDGGWLRTASIGGQATWRKDLGTGHILKDENGKIIGELNKDGYLESEYFDLYEISLPTIPSNPTAATESSLMTFDAMIYKNEDIENISGQLVTLSTQIKEKTMAKEKKLEAVVEEIVQTEKLEEVQETMEQPAKVRHIKLGILGNLVELAKAAFGHPEGEYGDMPIKEQPVKAEEAVKQEEAVKPEEMAVEPKNDDETSEKKEEVIEESVMALNETKEECKNKTLEVTMAVEPIKHKFQMIPEVKTVEETAELKLAAPPTMKVEFKEGVTFTKLSEESEGKAIISRVLNPTAENKQISDYKVVLNAIMADPKVRPFVENTRFHVMSNDNEMAAARITLSKAERQSSKVGTTFAQIAANINQGSVTGIDWKLGLKDARRTTLSTDGAFSSLDTTAVEWLPTILFALFPKEDWKRDIPVFSVYDTGRNLGIIWTNIAANAAVYRGTNPAPAAAYTYSDTPVGLKLVPYWMQPTRWTPMDMHTKRYDQFATGMAQNMKKLEAIISDDYLYTLGAGALANGRIMYTGGPIDSTQSPNFTVGAGSNGVDAFYFNSNYAGSLLKPGFNDIMKIEQSFKYMNFDLKTDECVLIGDEITESYIKQDKATQSYLTRWIKDDGEEVLKISNTKMHSRSRVIAYDPSGGTVIDCNASGAVIPATTQSANIALVPSQVGIGLGIIDVFFVQDPANYGFVHSMDMRAGIRALRSDYKGVTIYGYNTPVVP